MWVLKKKFKLTKKSLIRNQKNQLPADKTTQTNHLSKKWSNVCETEKFNAALAALKDTEGNSAFKFPLWLVPKVF